MALPKLPVRSCEWGTRSLAYQLQTSRGFQTLVAGHSFFRGQAAWHYRPQIFRASPRTFASQPSPAPEEQAAKQKSTPSEASKHGSAPSSASPSPTARNQQESMPPGWEDDPDLSISAFSQLPHRHFGTNQHIRINEDFKESLRQVLWKFRAPIRYAFAYGSGVFGQANTSTPDLSPHPHPPEAVTKWQQGGGKIIDFVFGVSFTQHWHSINLQDHPDHYSLLRLLGSYPISKIQDSIGAGVYFNPYITVNGIMIKYGVVNLDTICRDLSEWDTLYLAGRLQKPVKILRDDPSVRLANQINLMSAVRTALLMLPEKFTERQLYEQIAGLSYMGDPRMSYGGENPQKVANIVKNQLPNFRQLYVPLIDNLPNVDFSDSHVPKELGWEKEQVIANSGRAIHDVAGGPDGFQMRQDLDPQRRANMVRRLPKLFRQKLYYQYRKKFNIPGSAFDKIVDESNDEDAGGFRRREGGDFERRIGQQNDLEEVVGRCIRNTVGWPSTVQTVKGVFTSGIGRSWRYYTDKRGKSRESAASKKNAKSEPAPKQKGE